MVFTRLLEPIGIDFPQFYEAVTMLFSGLNPYQTLLTLPGPFNYPPPSFLFLWWLNLFPYNLAGAVWNIASLSSFIVSVWLMFKIARQRHFLIFLFIFLLTFFPLKHNLASGQINNFLLLFLTLTLYSQHTFFLAYATAIKIIPVLFLLYFFLRKDRQAIKVFLISLILLFFLSFFLVPWDSQKIYYGTVASQAWPLSGKEIYYNQSLLAFLARALHSPSIIQLFYYLLATLIIFLTWWRGRGISKNRQIAAVFSLLLLLPPLVWQHHYVLSAIPLILLFSENKLLVIVSYLLIASNIKNPSAIPNEFNFLLSHQFFGVFILWSTALWKEKFWQVVSIIWIATIMFAYVLVLLCRAKFCF